MLLLQTVSIYGFSDGKTTQMFGYGWRMGGFLRFVIYRLKIHILGRVSEMVAVTGKIITDGSRDCEEN